MWWNLSKFRENKFDSIYFIVRVPSFHYNSQRFVNQSLLGSENGQVKLKLNQKCKFVVFKPNFKCNEY